VIECFCLSFFFLFCVWLGFMTTIATMRVMVLLLRWTKCNAHTIVSMPKTSIATRFVCRCSMLGTNLLVSFCLCCFSRVYLDVVVLKWWRKNEEQLLLKAKKKLFKEWNRPTFIAMSIKQQWNKGKRVFM
jgi:hypothetical protein